MSVISTSDRLSARAAAIPAKPPPTIKTRFLFGAAFVAGGVSCGNDLVRTVVMEVGVQGASRPIGIGYNGASGYSWTALRRIGRPCVIVRERARGVRTACAAGSARRAW